MTEKTDNLDNLADLNDADLEGLLSDDNSSKASQKGNISLLNDLPVKLSMIVDSVDITIGSLLGLSEGEVLPLNKKANEPMDITVNGKLIARGEVVVVDGRYGVRLVEVVNKSNPGAADKTQ